MSFASPFPACRTRFVRRALLLLTLLPIWHAAHASQPTPPVSIEVHAKPAQDTGALVAVLTITAHTELSGATLRIDGAARELRVGVSREALRLAPDRPATVEVPITVRSAGAHVIDLRVDAQARAFETAGAFERRYVVWDGRSAPRLLTGMEVRREHRQDIDRALRERLRSDPDAGIGIDDLLRQALEPVRDPPPIDEKAQQALVPPAGGIEPYEHGSVIDKTADVIRELDPITITGRLWYTDRSGTLRPLINATVDIRDSDTGPDEQLTSVVTGWDGRYNAVVNNDDGWFQNGRDIYIRVRTTNSRFRVQDCAAWPDWTYAWESEVRGDLSDGTVVNFGDLATNADNEASLLFQDLNQGWNFLTTSGGQDPGFVDLCWPEGSSVYSTFWEEIDIEDGDEVARDIVLHEYGHATMHNAYDGDWPSNTGGPHGFDDILHSHMAFTEGWGTFIALSINDDGIYDSNGWSRRIEAFSHGSGHSDGDGTRNEGHVAAGMGDVRDTRADGSCAGGAQCDASGADAASMAQIWRDSFWRSKADDIEDYWPRLCAELGATQGTVAVSALGFNEIDVDTCKCTVTLALDLFDARVRERSIADLRTLRDRGLRNSALGQRVIDIYYRHTAEVSSLLARNPDVQRMAATLFVRAAEATRVLLKGGADDAVMLDAEHARTAREVLAYLRDSGSEALQRDFDEVERMVDTFEGRSYAEVQRKFSAARSPK